MGYQSEVTPEGLLRIDAEELEKRKRRPSCFNDRREYKNTTPTHRAKIRMCIPCRKQCIEVRTCPIHEWGEVIAVEESERFPSGTATVGMVYKKALAILGYPDTDRVRDLCFKRFCRYMDEWSSVLANIEPIDVIARHGEINIPRNKYGNVVAVAGADDGQTVFRLYPPRMVEPDDDLGVFTEKADKLSEHIILREKMYRSERGTPMRRSSFVTVRMVDQEPKSAEDGVIYVLGEQKQSLVFKCPCGCGRIERLPAERTNNMYSREEVHYDRYGRKYTCVRGLVSSNSQTCCIDVNAGEISVYFPRRIKKACQTSYSVRDNQITWGSTY